MSDTGSPNEFRIFAAIAERGSFIAAARALKVPKTTVSRRIDELEARLGVRLLQRTTRTLSLTEAGQTFLAHCVRILAEINEAEDAIGQLAATPRGTLTVTAPFSIGANYLARALPAFLRHYPDIRVELMVRNDMVDLVAENVDLGIRVSNPGDSGLVSRHLGAVQNVVVASPIYLHQAGIPREFDDLARHRTLALSLRDAYSGRYFWSLQRQGGAVRARAARADEEHVAITPVFTANDPEPLCQAALVGQGIACLPYLLVGRAIKSGALTQLFPGWGSAPVPIHAVYPSRRGLQPKVRVFVDFLIEQFAGLSSVDSASTAPVEPMVAEVV